MYYHRAEEDILPPYPYARSGSGLGVMIPGVKAQTQTLVIAGSAGLLFLSVGLFLIMRTSKKRAPMLEGRR